MGTLTFDSLVDQKQGFRPNAHIGNTIFEVLVELKDLRGLRASLMDIARYSAEGPDRHGILVLEEPHISESRLHNEWTSIGTIFCPDVFRRLGLVIHRNGAADQILGMVGPQERELIPAVILNARQHSQTRSRGQADIFYDLLRILTNQWMRRAGPLTSRWLAEAAGCTYPTVAATLKELEPSLLRHSDRRVELKGFPKDAWFRLVANAEKVRQPLRFADTSGQPRSTDSLLSRLQKLHPEGVAIAGVPGARRLFPGIDLIGTPRLDLSIHTRNRQLDPGFMRQIDPALKPVGPEEPARVVIHILRYPYSFFETDAEGSLWADPVECLLDLHEMRLESQAWEFLQAMTPKG